MKVALIPPASQLHHCVGRPFQMMIPDFTHSLAYQRYYKKFGLDPNTFVILDNGAFEGGALDDYDLLQMAAEYRVDEVASPDTLGDYRATLTQLDKFVAIYRHPSHTHTRPSRLMAIVQGQTIQECRLCIAGFSKDRFASIITTIGLPKHLAATTGRDDVRHDLTSYINHAYPDRWDIHYLGFVAPGEMMGGAQLGVRSLDTSAPFICTAENLKILPDSGPTVVPSRQNWFSNLGPEYFHPLLVKENIDCVDLWAIRGDD